VAGGEDDRFLDIIGKSAKMKEIYQLLESITDKCEDVANVIEGIVLENA